MAREEKILSQAEIDALVAQLPVNFNGSAARGPKSAPAPEDFKLTPLKKSKPDFAGGEFIPEPASMAGKPETEPGNGLFKVVPQETVKITPVPDNQKIELIDDFLGPAAVDDSKPASTLKEPESINNQLKPVESASVNDITGKDINELFEQKPFSGENEPSIIIDAVKSSSAPGFSKEILKDTTTEHAINRVAFEKPGETPAPKTGEPKYEKYSSNEVANLKKTVAELTKANGQVAGVMQRLERIEAQISQMSSLLRLSPAKINDLEKRVNEISGRLDEMKRRNLDVRKEFQCSRCKSKHAVALHVKCTTCGEETWMGWWPDRKKK